MIKRLLCLGLLASSCGSTEQQASSHEASGVGQAASVDQAAGADTPGAAPLEASDAPDLSSWGTELIELPPGFAPGLPKGRESLLFAPGMFTAGAEDLWSYVFVAELEAERFEQAQLQDFLERYYNGLISAVAEGKDLTLGDPVAEVRLRAAGPGRFQAEILTTDAFVSGEPIRVLLDAAVEQQEGQALLKVMASLQERDHAIWERLAAALGAVAF